ncbi:MAG: hypothetical protein NHB32_01595 [Fischerella sp. CENA71]|nr:hypothetical protein [Fischerella sp. CENA71]
MLLFAKLFVRVDRLITGYILIYAGKLKSKVMRSLEHRLHILCDRIYFYL